MMVMDVSFVRSGGAQLVRLFVEIRGMSSWLFLKPFYGVSFP